MNVFDLPETAFHMASGVGRGAVHFARLACSGLRAGLASEPSKEKRELHSEFWEIRRLLNATMGSDPVQVEFQLRSFLVSISGCSEEIQRAVVVWIDLVETLVQHAEQRYGRKAGQGKVKAAEVKAALRYLMRDEFFAIPGIPRLLEHGVLEVLIDWSVDGVVLIANRYGLWTEDREQGKGSRSLVERLRDLLRYSWTSVFIVPWLFGRIGELFEKRTELSPDIRSYLDAVRHEGLIVGEKRILTGGINVLVWVGQHRAFVFSTLEIVITAVHQAEGYLGMTGSEKKAYVHDLVLAALDNLGFEDKAGLLFALVESGIDSLTEASVHIFNKRHVFAHRGDKMA